MTDAGQVRLEAGIDSHDLGEVIVAVEEDGADVNKPGRFREPPIHLCAAYGLPLSIVEYLVSKGADVRARTGEDCTVLHRAGLKPDVCAWLLAETDAIEDVNTLDLTGQTPLHWTWSSPGKACVLIAFGAGTEVEGAEEPVLDYVSRLSRHPKADWLALFQVSARVPRRVLTSWLVDGREYVGVDDSDRETFAKTGYRRRSPVPVVDVASRLVEAWPLDRCLVLHGLVVATGRRDGTDVYPSLKGMKRRKL